MRNPDAIAGLIGRAAFFEFAASVRGRLIAPGDADFDAARAVWNGAIDRRPGLIVRCAGAADVIECVRFAREHDLVVAVRGGGHNVAGTAVCEGGLVIDLSELKGIRIDPRSRVAQAQPGLVWGEYDRETQSFGLATPGGIVTHTGVAGLTLGGGIGWLMRAHGLTADHLVAADVVTADGELVRASDEDDPDLLWALKGGGGNFGVVTSFEFLLRPVGPTVLAGPVVFGAEEAADVLRFYRS
jgi:FAD/FMN-containing dehydrogenase